MTEHKSFRSLISERQHEAEAALVRGDVGPRLRMWLHNDPVALFAAVGPSKTGWDELEATFRTAAPAGLVARDCRGGPWVLPHT